MDLLVVGSVALDTVETPSDRREEILGGSACFISIAAGHFVSTGVVAVVGDDFPAEHRTLLEQRGVDTAGLQTTPGRTFRWSGRYLDNMKDRVSLSTELGVFEHFDPELPPAACEAPVLFLGNIHPCLQSKVLEQAKGARFVGLDTMNYWIEGTPEPLAEVLRHVDVLLINDEEARGLSGCESLNAAAARIRAMGPRWLVIKRGEFGALLFGEGELFAVPAMLLDVVRDPTGAGDSFAGGFMGYLARQETIDARALREAMIYGTVLASFSVEDFSLEGLTRADSAAIERRRAELLRMTQI